MASPISRPCPVRIRSTPPSPKMCSARAGSHLTPLVRVLLAVCLFLFGGAGANAKPISIYTVNYPLQYMAERIAMEHGTIVFPAPPGIDPAFWRPPAETINDYQSAELIILNGAGYAAWVRSATLSPRRLVDTSRAFADRFIGEEGATKHQHGPDGDHSHRGVAFTTWLDMTQAIQQAASIKEALVRVRPHLRQEFERNYAALETDLLMLDRSLSRLGRQITDPVLASHPIYQYLARRYGLDVKSMLWEPDQMPDEEQWRLLASTLSSRQVKFMIWEAPPAGEIESRLASLGVRVVVFDPAFNRPERGDFLDIMKANIRNLTSLRDSSAADG